MMTLILWSSSITKKITYKKLWEKTYTWAAAFKNGKYRAYCRSCYKSFLINGSLIVGQVKFH